MAVLTRVSTASVDANTAMFAGQISGDLYAGEALDVCAACYIKAADGKVYMSTGAADTEPAKFDGFTPRAYSSGEAVTLYNIGVRMQYGSGLTPGADYYVSATAGKLADAASTGGTTVIARAINATDIRCVVAAAT